MTSRIYLLDDGGQFVDMEETPYLAEDLLQELLVEHPKLLAEDQINEGDPRQWLFMTRELALATDDSGAAKMWLDHLFSTKMLFRL